MGTRKTSQETTRGETAKAHVIPRRFCWTKFGSESGEGIEAILARKDRERVANGGIFLWGIGNSVGPGIRALVRLESEPMAVFSPMRAKPKAIDTAPGRVVVWRSARGIDGNDWEIPTGSMVVSRGDSGKGTMKRTHYALVCRSDKALATNSPSTAHLSFSALSNLVSGAPVGYSQVTSIVDYRADPGKGGPNYDVGFLAQLVYPYFIELFDPLQMGADQLVVAATKIAARPHRMRQLSIE
jgi:hypothetical protein